MASAVKNGFEACTGCKLCQLPCPVFRRTHDVMLTMHGRMKALQAGAHAGDLLESVDACLLCGACEAVCPENIDLIPILLDMRQENIQAGRSSLPRIDLESNAGFSGEKILKQAKIRKLLGPEDLLVIDTRPYNTDFAHKVRFYDQLKKDTGCQLNLDLQRTAIPTGAASLQAHLGVEGLELASQAKWLIEGRSFSRMIVENPADLEMLKKVSKAEIILLADLKP